MLRSPLLLLVFLCSNVITIEGSFRIVVSPNVTTIQRPVGDQVELICKVEGTADEKIGLVWTKNTGIDKTGNVEVNRLDPFNIALIIKNASVADSGFYICTASGSEHAEKTVDVFYFNELRFIDLNPHIDNILPTANVNVSCRVSMSEGEKIRTSWTRYGAPLPADSTKFSFFLGGAILQVSSFDPSSDPGEYVCLVENLTTGTKIKQTFALGGHLSARRTTCMHQCRNFCTNLFDSKV